MFGWIWKVLPGNKALKLLQVLILTAGAIAALYFYVFPWMDSVIYPETDF